MSDGTEAIVVDQAGQVRHDGASIGVVETLEDDEGRWAVLSIRTRTGAVCQVELAEGESEDVDGLGTLTLVGVRGTSAEAGRGAVAFRIG